MYTRDFQERKRFEHFFYSWTAILATTIFLVIALFGTVKLWQKERVISDEIANLDAEIAKTDLALQKSANKLKSLDTEEGIEDEARGKFNLKKEGEVMVIFLDGKQDSQKERGFWTGAEASTAKIWQNLKNWLGF